MTNIMLKDKTIAAILSFGTAVVSCLTYAYTHSLEAAVVMGAVTVGAPLGMYQAVRKYEFKWLN